MLTSPAGPAKKQQQPNWRPRTSAGGHLILPSCHYLTRSCRTAVPPSCVSLVHSLTAPRRRDRRSNACWPVSASTTACKVLPSPVSLQLLLSWSAGEKRAGSLKKTEGVASPLTHIDRQYPQRYQDINHLRRGQPAPAARLNTNEYLRDCQFHLLNPPQAEPQPVS